MAVLTFAGRTNNGDVLVVPMLVSSSILDEDGPAVARVLLESIRKAVLNAERVGSVWVLR